MRYLATFRIALPAFALGLVLLDGAEPGPYPWPALAGGVLAGALLGTVGVRILRRRLLHGTVHWSMRPPPGGVWFFVVAGLGLAVPGVMIWKSDRALAVALGAGGLALALTMFGIIGAWVFFTERKHGKEIWLLPDGIEFGGPLNER